MELILIRHGESDWNKKDLFTGWEDVPLSPKGLDEAMAAGQLLKDLGYQFDYAYSSMLKRAIKTLWIVLEQLDQCHLPIEKNWQLNERHYGELQGKNKTEMRQIYGEEQVHLWRRSYNLRPPASSVQPVPSAYEGLPSWPVGESLEDTVNRVVPYWENIIKPRMVKGSKILIVAHGNSLRALIKHLANIADDKIVELNIPTGKPIVCSFDQNNEFLNYKYL